MLRATMLAAACLCVTACGGESSDGDAGNNAAVPAAGVPSAAAGGGDAKSGQARATLLDTLTGGADHATLANAVNAAGLSQTFSGAQPYSIFAPTNAAFEKL